ncbi:probable inactive purple acid phosphatase 28 isoform X2 [Daucus carota subsp. sativus]|uniref:probable inactive purple acid phosphatase 28 isoform X2 n=1 Tax=Daucus carota subsp. sativus TaxID=79200 RepID=UPI0007EF08F6|nr:PREDICTED: probable inactive purple acid phosphatase 28 isoform X2 [Daucus carota subsp. sativus]
MKSQQLIWIQSFVYVILISFCLYLIQTLISPKLLLAHLNNNIILRKKQPTLPLRFRSDGTFKILQVADMHYGNGITTRCRDVLATEFDYCSDLNTTRFLKRMIEAEKPDFVAFTGDNIFGTSASDAAESLLEVFRPVIESGLPWAAVLGNHDQESTMTREELMSFISLMDYSVSQPNPLAGDTREHRRNDIDGFGNYNLQVFGTFGSPLANSSVLNLYFLDSGDRAIVDGIRTYGWIKESQLVWLRGVSKQLQDCDQLFGTSSHVVPPSLAFFHIPIPEIRAGPLESIVGEYQEYAACSSVNSGVLQTLVSMGDVKAVFIGHDHTNDFCGYLKGIWFCYGGGFGYHGYGRAGKPRRARVVLMELEKGDKEWMGVERIKTWKRYDDEKLSKVDEQVLWDIRSSR